MKQAPFEKSPSGLNRRGTQFDRHGGETAVSLYLIPMLVELDKAKRATLTMPDHLTKMLSEVVAGDPTTSRVFRAEGLKPEETGKPTSAKEVSPTGVWSVRDPREATVESGRIEVESFVNAAVQFIERWKALAPMKS